MKAKMIRNTSCLVLAAAVLSLFACKRATRIMVVKDGHATWVNYSQEDPPPRAWDDVMTIPWEEGWVALFRTTEKSPLGDVGKAGEIYRVKNKKLVKIGKFDLNKSDWEAARPFFH